MPSRASTSASGVQPTISRVLADGTIVEMLYNMTESTTALAVARLDGERSVEPYFDLPTGERLVPYGATNNLLTSGCVLFPQTIGGDVDTASMANELGAFISRYVDLSPAFAEIAPYYVLLSWVYDAFHELPYLRFRGDYGTGKTRALQTLGSLCYKPFFASGASTVSPIFHVLDVFGGTLILDEADLRFSDATAQLTKILNNGTTDGMPVLRTMSNRHGELSPRAFKVFGPKIVAMRESFADRALESRFLTEETGGRSLSGAAPIHMPREFHAEATAMRDRLLAWRFNHHAMIRANPSRRIPGAEPRLDQAALALLSIIDDADVRYRIGERLLVAQSCARQERAASQEGMLLQVLLQLFAESGADVAISRIAERFNAGIYAEMTPFSNKRIGSLLRTRLRVVTTKTRGVYVVPQSELPKLKVLAERYEMAGDPR